MKRILLLSCVSFLCTITLCAYDFEVNGIYYDILPDINSVKVTSKIDLITNHRMEYKGDIVIPEIVDYRGKTYCVTEISRYAFDGCTQLTSVSIPKGVSEIVRYSFANCSNLQTISIADTCIVRETAFQGCDNLQYAIYDNAKYLGDKTNPYRILVSATDKKIPSCVIHEQTIVIAESAFYRCTRLKEITIPENVFYVGVDAFGYCKRLTKVRFTGDTLPFILEGSFEAIPRRATFFIKHSAMEKNPFWNHPRFATYFDVNIVEE